MGKSWKDWALPSGGLKILFYKRSIQYLPEHSELSDDEIFRSIDLTMKQLDSLKYIIELKK